MKPTSVSTSAIRVAASVFAACILCSTLASCGGGSDGQDPDPLVEDFGIAFVRRPLVVDEAGLLQQPDIRRVQTFNVGGDLFFRDLASPSAPERNVTGSFTGGEGDVKDV